MTEEYDKQEAKLAKILKHIDDRCFDDVFIDSMYELLFGDALIAIHKDGTLKEWKK